MKHTLLIHLVLLCHLLSVFSLVWINEEKSIKIVQLSNIGTFPNETLELVFFGPNVNVSGRVVYLDAPSYISEAAVAPYRKKINSIALNGGKAVISSSNHQILPSEFPYGTFKDYPIPVGIISFDASIYLYSSRYSGNSTNITFVDWDKNPWDYIYTGPIYIATIAISILMFLVNFIYTSFLIVKWVKANWVDWNIGFICLLLELIGNFIRVFEMILDPLHPNFLLPGLDVILSLPVCISIITSILIVFFWLDLTSDPFYHGKFLGVMKIPAIIFIFIILFVEILFDVLRNLESTTNLFPYLEGIILFYTIIHLCVVIFNFVAGYKILNRLKENKKKELRSLIKRIIASGVVTVFGILILILMVTQVMSYPISHIIVWWLIHFSYFLQSLLLITIFQVPEKKKDTTKGTSSIKESSTNSTA